MAQKAFGGQWSETKLRIIENYLISWLKVMKNQSFSYFYIDAFAGSGLFEPKADDAIAAEDAARGRAIIEGSALRALRLNPCFDRYDFIELNSKKAEALKAQTRKFSDRTVRVHNGDVNDVLPELCGKLATNDRAVVFLDPFGAQVNWNTVEAIAASEKVDLWYLLPVSILNRLISDGNHASAEGWKRRVTACLGTDDWQDEFFKPSEQLDMFNDDPKVREAGVEKVEAFFIKRLRGTFAFVMPRCFRLVTPNGTHLFSLCFAVSNPSPKAIGAATRIANHLIDGES